MNSFGHILFSSVFCGFGMIALWAVWAGMRKEGEVRNWPSASGVVTESTTAGSFQRCGSSNMWIEAPKIAYIYSVNGEKYTGDQISVAEVDSASKEDAVRKIAPYPVGKEVEVFYNPKDPKDAVLEKESGDMAFVLLGVLGVGLLIVGVVIWFYPM